MASSKRKKHGAGYVVLIAVLILVLLAVVAAATGYSLVARRVKALQAGAAFTFDYEITSTTPIPLPFTPSCKRQAPPRAPVNGLYAPDALQLSISAPDAVIRGRPAHPGVYQQQRDLIRCRAAVQKYPLFTSPAATRWRAFCCRTGALAVISRRPSWQACWVWTTTATSLQDMTEFELAAEKAADSVQPENAKDGYLYFQLDTGDASRQCTGTCYAGRGKEQVLLRMPSRRAHPAAPSRNTASSIRAHRHRECPDRCVL